MSRGAGRRVLIRNTVKLDQKVTCNHGEEFEEEQAAGVEERRYRRLEILSLTCLRTKKDRKSVHTKKAGMYTAKTGGGRGGFL